MKRPIHASEEKESSDSWIAFGQVTISAKMVAFRGWWPFARRKGAFQTYFRGGREGRPTNSEIFHLDPFAWFDWIDPQTLIYL
jgi:hypothetical protein